MMEGSSFPLDCFILAPGEVGMLMVEVEVEVEVNRRI